MIHKAMVLAAGNGTRLHPLTIDTPKPLISLHGKPIIEYNLNLLKKHGIHEVYINACYLSDKMADYFHNRPSDGLSIHLNIEKEMMGSAGGLKLLEHYFTETFLVISGDLLTNAPLDKLVQFHLQHNAIATMGVTHVENPCQYGVVLTNECGRITRFQEKPKTKEEAFSDIINTGIYVFSPEIFQYIPQGVFFDFSKDLFPILLKEGLPLYAFSINSYWRDLGTIPELQKAEKDICNHIFLE